MLFLSNYVDSPRIAACPSDLEKVPAADFTDGPQGLMGLGARATSYAIQTEMGMSFPMSLLMSDGKIEGVDPVPSTCAGAAYVPNTWSYRVIRFRATTPGLPHVHWLPELHASGTGNILFVDGRVTTVDGIGLARAYSLNPVDGNNRNCTMMP